MVQVTVDSPKSWALLDYFCVVETGLATLRQQLQVVIVVQEGWVVFSL